MFNVSSSRYLFPIIEIQHGTISQTSPQLSYSFALPPGELSARLVILHGYGDHAGRHAHVLQSLAGRGIACYALDFRGHGRSAGKPGFVRRWDEHLDDLARFLALPELVGDPEPLFVLGHSHGGLIAASAAMQGMLDHCRGVILVAPYFRLKMPVPAIKRLTAVVGARLFPSLAIKSGLNGPMLTRDQQMIEQGRNDPYTRGIATPRWFVETAKVQQQVRSSPEKFKQPLLMLLPGHDTVADEQASLAFFDSCSSSDKTKIHYPENRHELLRELDREKAFADIIAWIGSHKTHVASVGL